MQRGTLVAISTLHCLSMLRFAVHHAVHSGLHLLVDALHANDLSPSLPLSLHQSAHPTNELFPAPLSLQRPGTTCKGNQKRRFSTLWHSTRKCFNNSYHSQKNIYQKGQHAITSCVEHKKTNVIQTRTVFSLPNSMTCYGA